MILLHPLPDISGGGGNRYIILSTLKKGLLYPRTRGEKVRIKFVSSFIVLK